MHDFTNEGLPASCPVSRIVRDDRTERKGHGSAAAESKTDSTPNQHTVVQTLDRCSGDFAAFDVTFHSLVHETSDGAVGTHSVILIQGLRVGSRANRVGEFTLHTTVTPGGEVVADMGDLVLHYRG